MKKVTIAFDIDGTLRDNTKFKRVVANEGTRAGLIWLSGMKNTRIIVWSGSGELYARQAAAEMGITSYVDGYANKNHVGTVNGVHKFDPELDPDIAIDDIQACDLGRINLIVREK